MRQLSGKVQAPSFQEARKLDEDAGKRARLDSAARRWGDAGPSAEPVTDEAVADTFETRAVTGTTLTVRSAGEMFGEQVRSVCAAFRSRDATAGRIHMLTSPLRRHSASEIQRSRKRRSKRCQLGCLQRRYGKCARAAI